MMNFVVDTQPILSSRSRKPRLRRENLRQHRATFSLKWTKTDGFHAKNDGFHANVGMRMFQIINSRLTSVRRGSGLASCCSDLSALVRGSSVGRGAADFTLNGRSFQPSSPKIHLTLVKT